MAETEIGSSFGAELDLWLSSQLLPSVFICFAGLYYVEFFFFISLSSVKMAFMLPCSLHVWWSNRQNSLEPLDLLKANIYPDICGLLTIFSCVCWQLASGIYSFACSFWSHHTDCFLQQIYARDDAAALGSLERTLLSLKGSKCQPPHADALSTFSNRKVQVIH